MEGLLVLSISIAALSVLVALALRFGVDSRPELGDLRQPGLSV